ncbi:hypothetical protein TrVE_jg5672 [Triparma verrucosa]|uniref:Autophagy-related protein n=1 Tax=Triparma verrucosa TaxID=1606542 RepID=A0A9W7EQT6_9STRA|nr:hypothetical protein TrVE_jg5672 [Triparma verrucosa]
MSDKDTQALTGARRLSVNATSRLSNLSASNTPKSKSGGATGIGQALAGSRKMSAVDATARLSMARNNVNPAEKVEVTTDQELKGWYMYDFANGAFFYSVLNFLPILIKNQALYKAQEDFCGECPNNEWAVDFDNQGSCALKAGCIHEGDSYTNQTCVEDGGEWSGEFKLEASKVNFLGITTGFASVSFMCTVISVVLQLFVFVGFGGLADYGDLRKKMFIGANTVGSLCCMLVMFGESIDMFWFNGLMMIIANVSYGFSVVFYNAYLPLLTMAHPDVAKVADSTNDESQIIDVINTVSSRISTRGFATGFTGQLIFLIINFAIFTFVPDGGFAARFNVALCGVWTMVFGGYCFMNIKTRPGPPLPAGETYISVSVKQVKKTIGSWRELPQLFLFLGSYFIFSDGCSTMAGAAAVFASIELKMASSDILLGILLVSIMAIASCIIWFKIEKMGMPPKWILITNLTILGCMPIYGMVAMTCQWEFYVMCAVFGLMTGSQQAYTRSLFSANVPQGHEAEYFSFYEVTDKGSAWAGPMIIGIVFDRTGNYRASFTSLLAFFVVGIFVLLFFDPKKAAEQCKAFEEKEKKQKNSGVDNTL